MILKDKRILITAGPTWIPIDRVRVISNIATGETGIILAERLQKLKAKVTLLLGPVEACCLNRKIKLIRFIFFNELKHLIVKELKSRKYDIVIHSAAVSDYMPLRSCNQKVKSGIRKWRLILSPTSKIINLIKKIDERLFLVGFKFEPDADRDKLIKEAKGLISRSNLDLAVSNSINHNKYRAYVIKEKRIYGPVSSKQRLAKELIKIIGEAYGTTKINR